LQPFRPPVGVKKATQESSARFRSLLPCAQGRMALAPPRCESPPAMAGNHLGWSVVPRLPAGLAPTTGACRVRSRLTRSASSTRHHTWSPLGRKTKHGYVGERRSRRRTPLHVLGGIGCNEIASQGRDIHLTSHAASW